MFLSCIGYKWQTLLQHALSDEPQASVGLGPSRLSARNLGLDVALLPDLSMMV